jgi:hypothetical protein
MEHLRRKNPDDDAEGRRRMIMQWKMRQMKILRAERSLSHFRFKYPVSQTTPASRAVLLCRPVFLNSRAAALVPGPGICCDRALVFWNKNLPVRGLTEVENRWFRRLHDMEHLHILVACKVSITVKSVLRLEVLTTSLVQDRSIYSFMALPVLKTLLLSLTSTMYRNPRI